MSRKSKRQRAAAQQQRQPEPDPQAMLPPWLRFRVGADTARADATIAHVTQALQRYLATKTVPQVKPLLEEYLLPLIGGLMQLVVHQQADTVNWAQTALMEAHRLAAEENLEVIEGIPSEQADELLQQLEAVMAWFERVDACTPDTDAFRELLATAPAQREALAEVAETIDDLAIEEGDEDEDEDEEEGEDEDEEGDEEPLEDEPPMIITDRDAQPLVR